MGDSSGWTDRPPTRDHSGVSEQLVDRSGEPTTRAERPPRPASAVRLCNEPTVRRLGKARLKAGIDHRVVEVGVVLAHHGAFFCSCPSGRRESTTPGRPHRDALGMGEPVWRNGDLLQVMRPGGNRWVPQVASSLQWSSWQASAPLSMRKAASYGAARRRRSQTIVRSSAPFPNRLP